MQSAGKEPEAGDCVESTHTGRRSSPRPPRAMVTFDKRVG